MSSSMNGTALSKDAFLKALKLAEEIGLETCTIPDILIFGQPYSNGLAFHDRMSVVAGVAALLCCVITFSIAAGHLMYYVKPQEQKQLIRVILTLPIFAACSFFGCLYYLAAPYLQPVPQIFESLGIVAIFYFYVTSITPNQADRERFYDSLQRHKDDHYGGKGSLGWFHLIWILVFQICLGRIGTTIVYEYFQASLCPLDPQLPRRKAIITLVQTIQTVIAVVGVIWFERRMKRHLQGRRAGAKLITFKLIVLLEAIQNLIFKVLTSAGVLTPSYYISTFDYSVGIPACMLCCELLCFAMAFWWSYSIAPYRKLAIEGHAKVSWLRGLLDVVNIWDIILGIGYFFKALNPKSFGERYIQGQRDETMIDGGQKVQMVSRHTGSESEPENIYSASVFTSTTQE